MVFHHSKGKEINMDFDTTKWTIAMTELAIILRNVGNFEIMD